jgi:RNA polymerase sigma-70 factor (ECF subfamily)
MAERHSEQGQGNANGPTPRGGDGQVTPLSLLERVRRNDQEAWRRLLDLYGPLVRFWCGRAGVLAADTEDVAQEVFAAAAAGLAGFRRDRPGDTFRGWLRGITRNQVLLYLRRNGGRPQAVGGSEALQNPQQVADPLAEEAAEIGLVYRRALQQARGEIEERTWQAFWLTVVEDRSPAALTAELGMEPAAIRQAKARVLRRLKQTLGDLLE